MQVSCNPIGVTHTHPMRTSAAAPQNSPASNPNANTTAATQTYGAVPSQVVVLIDHQVGVAPIVTYYDEKS